MYLKKKSFLQTLLYLNTTFPLVVGEKERSAETVNVRTRDNVVHGEISVENLIKKFITFKETKDRNCEENF